MSLRRVFSHMKFMKYFRMCLSKQQFVTLPDSSQYNPGAQRSPCQVMALRAHVSVSLYSRLVSLTTLARPG